MTDTILRIIEDAHESTEYAFIHERIKAEIDAILSRAQTHYVNIIETQSNLNTARAIPLSDSAAQTITTLLEIIGTMKMDDLLALRGLLIP
jgi:hypothetical protein